MILSFIRGLLGGRSSAPSSESQPHSLGSVPLHVEASRVGASSASTSRAGKLRGDKLRANKAWVSRPDPELPAQPPLASASAESSEPAGPSEPIVLSFRLPLPSPANPPRGVSSGPRDLSSTAASLPTTPGNRLSQGDAARRGGAQTPRPQRHRPRSLRDAGLGSAAQRRALRSLEIRTTADLLAADPAEIAQRLGLAPGASRTLRRWQRAIRLSQQLPAMTAREALLLYAVHRKTLRSIAEESAPRLRRDLVRYAMSTAGTRLLADQPLPSPEQVKGWVETARKRSRPLGFPARPDV